MIQTTRFSLATTLALAACQPTVTGDTGGPLASNTTAASLCANAAVTHNWALEADDQRISGADVQSLVIGAQLQFDGSYEDYRADGTYAFVAGEQQNRPEGYVFYPDGSRCLAYSNPRYDLYVVNGTRLVLINQTGEHFLVGGAEISRRMQDYLAVRN